MQRRSGLALAVVQFWLLFRMRNLSGHRNNKLRPRCPSQQRWNAVTVAEIVAHDLDSCHFSPSFSTFIFVRSHFFPSFLPPLRPATLDFVGQLRLRVVPSLSPTHRSPPRVLEFLESVMSSGMPRTDLWRFERPRARGRLYSSSEIPCEHCCQCHRALAAPQQQYFECGGFGSLGKTYDALVSAPFVSGCDLT